MSPCCTHHMSYLHIHTCVLSSPPLTFNLFTFFNYNLSCFHCLSIYPFRLFEPTFGSLFLWCGKLTIILLSSSDFLHDSRLYYVIPTSLPPHRTTSSANVIASGTSFLDFSTSRVNPHPWLLLPIQDSFLIKLVDMYFTNHTEGIMPTWRCPHRTN